MQHKKMKIYYTAASIFNISIKKIIIFDLTSSIGNIEDISLWVKCLFSNISIGYQCGFNVRYKS